MALWSLQERFEELDRLLVRWQPVWSVPSFAHTSFPWPDRPELAAWLESLSSARIAELESETLALSAALQPFIPDAMLLTRLANTTRLAATPTTVDQALGFKVPGRKWQQILAFASTTPARPLPVVEWCAGKGHLGRVVAHCHELPVVSVEIDPVLCRQGADLATRHGTAQRFACVDALGSEAESSLLPEHQVLALHACGELHLQLIRKGAAHRVSAMNISPCCYHLIREEAYQPLSKAARDSSLRLSRQALQLPLQETVTAGNRVRVLRQKEVAWRLGFDLLQRELRGEDRYLTVPSIQKSMLVGEFEAFCRWAAAYKGIELPDHINYRRYERRGEQRFLLVRKADLVRNLFRRPLEMWLVLDRALYLEERGYRVAVGEFCDYRLTPRNLMIQASLLSLDGKSYPSSGSLGLRDA